MVQGGSSLVMRNLQTLHTCFLSSSTHNPCQVKVTVKSYIANRFLPFLVVSNACKPHMISIHKTKHICCAHATAHADLNAMQALCKQKDIQQDQQQNSSACAAFCHVDVTGKTETLLYYILRMICCAMHDQHKCRARPHLAFQVFQCCHFGVPLHCAHIYQ